MVLLTFLTILVISTNLFFGFFVWIRKKNSVPSKIFLLVTISVAGWVLSNYICGVFKDYDLVLFVTRLTFVFASLIGSSFLLFTFYFPKNTSKKSITNIIIVIGCIFTFLSFTSLINKDVIIVNNQYINDCIYGKLYYLYAIYIASFLIFGLINVLKNINKLHGIERHKISYVFTGLIISAFTGLFTNLIYPVFITKGLESQGVVLSFYGPLFTIFMTVFMAYAILKYRLFDIGIVIRRSAIRVISFTIIFGGYLFLVLSLKDSTSLNSPSEQTTFLVIATLVVVATIEPIRKFVHRIVDKAFESNEQKRVEAQKKIRLTLRSQQSVENLFISMSKIMQDLFNSDTSLFFEKSDSFFKNNKETFQLLKTTGKILITEELPYRFEEEERYFFIHQELEKTDYSALIPLGQDDIFMGCIVLGKRKNHEAYTVEEVREMKQLQEQFAEALWNARLYQQAIARIKI